VYDFRRWTDEQRRQVVTTRIHRGYPWHSPPHVEVPGCFRIITGVCFQHTHHLSSSERIGWFEQELLNHIRSQDLECTAWVVLSNHYHLLVKITDMRAFVRLQGQLHGRTAYSMNGEDETQGRQVWYRYQDRCMRSERHYYTTLNYIHNNPVKHGYVKLWGEWPFSSFHWYLQTKGRDWLTDVWRSYPVRNYGDSWDV
jgi:putative transposase